jgi:Tfp pilus assembly protein PilZ
MSDFHIRLSVEINETSPSYFYAGLSGRVRGVFVSTYQALGEGKSILLELDMPDGLTVAEGIVQWAKPSSEDVGPGLIVAFDELEPTVRESIDRLCAVRAPLYYDLDDRISQVG